MQQAEFRQWLAHAMNNLPDLDRWFIKCSDDQKEAIVEAWGQALIDIELRDARAVVFGIVSGDLPDVEGFERQLFAAHVRKHARELRFKRTMRESKADDADRMPARAGNGLRFGAMFRYVTKAVQDNVPRSEWVMRGLELLGIVPPEREPRYRCPTCCDTKFVVVFSAKAIQERRGNLPFTGNPSCAVACNCDAAYVLQGVARYDENRHCRIYGTGVSDRDLAILDEWISRHSYRGDFDAWNQGATA